jgi:hypothetical protein
MAFDGGGNGRRRGGSKARATASIVWKLAMGSGAGVKHYFYDVNALINFVSILSLLPLLRTYTMKYQVVSQSFLCNDVFFVFWRIEV